MNVEQMDQNTEEQMDQETTEQNMTTTRDELVDKPQTNTRMALGVIVGLIVICFPIIIFLDRCSSKSSKRLINSPYEE